MRAALWSTRPPAAVADVVDALVAAGHGVSCVAGAVDIDADVDVLIADAALLAQLPLAQRSPAQGRPLRVSLGVPPAGCVVDDVWLPGDGTLAWRVAALDRSTRPAPSPDAERLAGLLACCPDPTVIVDERGVIRDANGLAESLFGGALRGRSIESLMPARFRDGHPAHRAAFAAAPRPRAMGEARALFAVDATGREFPVEISLAPLALASGAVTVACLRDVSVRRQMEQRVRDAEQALLKKTAAVQSEILEALPAHVALLDGDGVVVAINDAWRDFGARNALRGDALGDNYLVVCDAAAASVEGARAAAVGIRRVLAREAKIFEQVYPCHGPTEEHWFRVVVVPAGQRGAVVMHVNVTDVRHAELKARDDEEALSITLASIGEAVIATDTSGRIARMNRVASQLTGFSEAEARGRVFDEVFRAFDEDTGAPLPNPVERVLREGTVVTAARTALRSKNGGVSRPIADTVAPIRDSDGGLRGVVIAFRDQTHERRALEVLQRTRRELLGVLERLPSAVCVLLDGALVFSNAAWCEALQRPSSEMLGLTLNELVMPDDRAVLERRLVDPGEPAVEVRFVSTGGDVVVFEVGPLVPVEHAGSAARAMVARNVTAEKRLQQQLLLAERMASVGTLAAGVAHEINNPLLVVTANVDLAHHEVRTARHALALLPSSMELVERALRTADEELDDAGEAAARVRFIVRDLKALSRSDDEVVVAVDLERVLSSSITMAQNEIRHRARLVREFDAVPAVVGNEPRLGQVFLNLLINAAQAIPEGRAADHEIRVVLRVDGEHVIAQVQDSGEGIAPQHLSRIFDPFFTTKAVGVGTGLGLAICQGIVRGFGGDIAVRSAVGVGTTFTVRLRRAPPQRAKCAPMPAPAAVARRGRVLVIDDDPGIGLLVTRFLSGEHDTVTAITAAEGLAHLAAGEVFDVILCDVMMPHMSAPDFYAALERAAPEQLAKIIFMSGGIFAPRVVAFFDTVTNVRIDKPFDRAQLCALVRERVTRAATS